MDDGLLISLSSVAINSAERSDHTWCAAV